MTKRAWWLVILNVLLPGSAQVLAGSRRLGRTGIISTIALWLVAAVGGVLFFSTRETVYQIASNSTVLFLVQWVLVFYCALWIVLTLDTLRLVRLVRVPPNVRLFVAGSAIACLAIAAGTAGYAASVAASARGVVVSVFSDGDIEPPIDGRYNVLLLGGDAGPDRDGLRPDSISVVSVDATTGEAVIVGIPRNLESFPFVAGSPMADLYPDGYGEQGCAVDVCFLNSIYTEVEQEHDDLYPDAREHGSTPGVEGMRDAVEAITGLTIQYYVLVDMQAFSDLIDAVGGITIESEGRYPVGGGEDANGNPTGVALWIEPGVQHMDGFTALWYARARHGTDDFDRMARQRQVQTAIIQQIEPANVLSNFQAIASASSQVVSTDIPEGMLGRFATLAQLTQALTPVDVELVPDNGVHPGKPDFALIHSMVAAAIAPSTSSPIPTP
jgi:LCP family protein required for cell wall assembly